jgi:hypothetical protein
MATVTRMRIATALRFIPDLGVVQLFGFQGSIGQCLPSLYPIIAIDVFNVNQLWDVCGAARLPFHIPNITAGVFHVKYFLVFFVG